MTNRERARSLLQGFSQVFWPKYEGPRAADAPRMLEDAITEVIAQAEAYAGADALERAARYLVELDPKYGGLADAIRALKGAHGR